MSTTLTDLNLCVIGINVTTTNLFVILGPSGGLGSSSWTVDVGSWHLLERENSFRGKSACRSSNCDEHWVPFSPQCRSDDDDLAWLDFTETAFVQVRRFCRRVGEKTSHPVAASTLMSMHWIKTALFYSQSLRNSSSCYFMTYKGSESAELSVWRSSESPREFWVS